MIDKDLREQLAKTTRDLFNEGVITGKGGNLSIRSQERDDAVWITPSQVHKGSLTADQMILVNFAGKKIEGEGRPSVEASYHAGLIEARKDINAVIHSHAPNATIFGLIDLEVPPITTEAIFISEYPKVPFYMAGSKDLRQAVIEALGDNKIKGAYLCNHGLVTLGKDLVKAAEKTLMVEQTLDMLFKIQLLGKEPTLMPDKAVKLLKQFGSVI